MNTIQDIDTIAKKSIYGGKAFWLSWLKQNRYSVPPAVFIPIDYKYNSNIQRIVADFFNNTNNTQTGKFAVRSSATTEDGTTESQAGMFNSFTNISSIELAIKKIPEIQNGRKNIGVIIQEYIEASYSGVIFSTNPNTGNKDDILINFTKGNSENLLSGTEIGSEIKISFSDINKLKYISTEIERSVLIELIKVSKQIEAELNYPVDIEWCVDKTTNKLFLVQCRPITNLSFHKTELIKVDFQNIDKIPPEILNNDKVKLRLNASKNEVLTTKAFLMIANKKDYKVTNISEHIEKYIKQNDLNLGYCEVLIKPSTLNGGVLRMFSANSNQDLAKRLEKMLKLTFKDYWQAVIIFHELYDLYYMGIIRKIQTNYLIEISYGGFIQKGITEFSQYVTSSNYKILNKNELTQKFVYEISNGKIEAIEINKKVEISENILEKIIKVFTPFIDKNLTIEFGISKYSNDYTPYLIDYIEDNTDISVENISEGIVSHGNITGKIINIDINNDWSKSIQTHFHDGKNYDNISQNDNENIVFVAEKPHISLVALLEEYDNKKIGFVFKSASILSHFCILLRENAIPSIISTKILENGELININTNKNFA
jgi:hypothetical protein